MSKTAWNPLYLAASVNGFIQGGYIVDTGSPVAVAVPPPDVTPASYQATPTPTFTVTYSDSIAINPATLTSANITIAGAGGVTLPVTLVGTSGSGPSITATYQVAAPTGDWTLVPNGTYVISLVGGQIKDTSGNVLAAEPLGSFQVTVNADANPPVNPATTPVGLTAVAGPSSIALSWSDPAGDQRSYLLQRALDAGFTQGVQNIPLTADAVSYTDAGAAVGQTYFYQLTAINPIGASLPTGAVTGLVLPPAPVLSRVILNDGTATRLAMMSATIVLTQPAIVTTSAVTLIQDPTGLATPIPVMLANPTGDGKTWIINWATNQFNNSLPDGNYGLTVHGGLIADAFGQTAGGDQTTNFTSSVGPVITSIVFKTSTPPASLTYTFSEDVSAVLSQTALTLLNTAGQTIPAVSYSWNPANFSATWTYAGPLPDGSYSARLPAAATTNVDGVKLDANGDGIPGDDSTYNFQQYKPSLVSLTGVANVNVNAPYTLNLGGIYDVGANPQYLIHWGDGNTSTYAANSTKATYTYASAVGPTKIVIDIIDANGTHLNCASLAVSVNRATIALGGNSNANPGVPYTLNLGAVKDTGYTVSKYIVHWGDGASSTYTTAGNVPHTYVNSGPNPLGDNITVDLIDNSGIGGAAFTNLSAGTLPLTVNPTPALVLAGDFNANAGGTYRLVLTPPVDNGFTPSSLTVNWGDGSAPLVIAPVNIPALGVVVTHTYKTVTAPGADVIIVGLTDNSGTFANVGSESVIVNPPPTVALGGNPNANVGGNYVLAVAPATDVAQTVSAYTINWGDGTSTVSATPGNFNHVYQSTGNPTIAVSVTDGTGTFNAGSMGLTVNNDPTIGVSGLAYANAGGVYTLNLGTAIDPGQTVSQYAVRWGDGQISDYSTTGPVTHTYAATGPATINVDLTDGTGMYPSAATLPISVTQPSVTLTGNGGVFVGQTYSLTINPASDQGGTPQQYNIHWGDGLSDTYAGTGVVTHTYTFLPPTTAANNVLVTADLVDNTGTFENAGTLSLAIAPPPTIVLAANANTNVGGTFTLGIGAVTDPIGTPSAFIVHWGDGSTQTFAAGNPVTYSYSTAGPRTISVDLVDQDGTYPAAATFGVTVNQPAVTLLGPNNAPLNRPYTLTLGNVFDPGQTLTQFTVHWGDGQQNTYAYAANAAVQHTFTATGNDLITVDLTDGIGTYATIGSLPVLISVPPSVTPAGNANANAGGSYTLSLASVTDLNGTPSQYVVNWGDGTSTTSASPGPFTHPYASVGSDTITVDVTDPLGVWTAAGTMPVTVNPAPTVALAGNANANPGGTYTLNLGAVTDPGYLVSQYTVHWGDGQTSNYTANGPVTHTFATPGPEAIAVDLTDPTGVFTSAGVLPITVNSTPAVALTGNANANAGGIYTLNLGAVSDSGYTVSQYAIHWGDGQTSTAIAGGPITHTFSATGPDTIAVDLTDPTGTYAAAGTLAVAVNPTPTIALAGNPNANLGGAYTLNLGAVSDPGYLVSQYTIHWGDGQTSNYTVGGSVSHTFTSAVSGGIAVDLTDATGTYASAGAYP